jgi:lysophospholipase L1-like esterase
MIRRTLAVCIVATCLVSGVGAAHAAGASSPSSGAASPATLLVLGDSLTWGANYFARLHERLSTQGPFTITIVDGWWSRRIGGITSTKYSGVNTLRALRKSGVSPAAVIVGLGTNDVQFLGTPGQYVLVIEELLAEIGPLPVTWLNVHRVDTTTTKRRSRIFNRTLADVALRHPNVTVVDWAGLVTSNPRLMAFDKIHLQPGGYEARSKVVIEAAGDLWTRHVAATTPTTVPATTTTVPDATTTTVPAGG